MNKYKLDNKYRYYRWNVVFLDVRENTHEYFSKHWLESKINIWNWN